MCMKNTTLCYIENNGKYLLLHRDKKKDDPNAYKWIGIGGKFEPGETAAQCLVREVYEETGLTLTAYIHVGVVHFQSDTYEDEDMYLFKGTSYEGNLVKECNEGTLEWFDAGEVLSLPTWEGDKVFLKPLLEGKTNLNITLRYEGDRLAFVQADDAEVEVDSSTILQSRHGFSNRTGGVSDGDYASLNLGLNRGDINARVEENWRRFMDKIGISYRPVARGIQVHGNRVCTVNKEYAAYPFEDKEIEQADGFVTNVPGLPVAVFTADCVPVLLEDTLAGVVGAVHCGWRSTVADIEAAVLENMCALGAKRENIRIAIGPAIDICCFEVGREVIDDVERLIGTDVAKEYYTSKANDKYMLNLRGVVKRRFLQLGIPQNNIDIVGGCTMCNPNRYYSHRYSQGARGSLASVIML